MAKAVISTIGHDRPGLVAELTSLAERLGLNIEDSRMTALGGEFAVLMALTGAAEALTQLQGELAAMASEDFTWIYRDTEERTFAEPTRPYQASVVALDHPGIVAAIAAFFSERSINIRDLNTETSPAAHTGTPIFSVVLTAEVPATIKVHQLKADFDSFCAEEDLDGQLEATT